MNKSILFTALLALIIFCSGCASKKYAKRGGKYEQAGMWELAAEAYIKSLSAKRDNVDVIVGLKRTGQKVIDDRCFKIFKAYESDQLKETVYGYLEVVEFKNRASAFGAELTISDMATSYYNDVKPKYIEKVYAESQQLMEAEKFTQAEGLLKEIQRIEPEYGDVQEMLKVSKCEPLYRQGKEFMTSGLNRKAYANFDKIIKEHTSYKDAKELKDEALSKALITIKVDDFKYTAGKQETAITLQGSVVSRLNALKNPFIKVVDTENTAEIIDEQRKNITVGYDIQVGKLLGAKAILSGTVVEFDKFEGKLQKTEKRGYLKNVKTIKNPTTGQEEKSVSYKKVIYYTYSVRNSAVVALKYQLSSIETGAVMVSDVLRDAREDDASYATFDGDNDKLVPGYWLTMDKDSPKDYVSDTPAEVSSLKKLLKAKRTVTPSNQLVDAATAEIAASVAQKINKYNPEQ